MTTLGEVVGARYGALVGFATVLTGNRSEAEDVVQDALVVVFSRSTAFETMGHAESYLRRTIASRFVDARRRRVWERAREIRVDREGARNSMEVGGEVAERLDVAAALASLSPRVRACVALRYLADQSIAETAAALGLTPGAVKRYVSDGIAALNRSLGTADEPSLDDGMTEVLERRAGR